MSLNVRVFSYILVATLYTQSVAILKITYFGVQTFVHVLSKLWHCNISMRKCIAG